MNAFDFEALYGDETSRRTLIPYDIGRPQPVVEQLVASGAVRGEVLDPGTGPGHHAILYASRGYSVVGIDASPSAIDHAQANARKARVKADFAVADATNLEEYAGRFDTVVDSAFYHVFLGDEPTQAKYVQALRRATRPGARLFMFEFGCHNVNGIQWAGVPSDNFERVLPENGWRLDYLGTSTYVARFGPEARAFVTAMKSQDGELVKRMEPFEHQLRVIAPLLEDDIVHMPIWVVMASRID